MFRRWPTILSETVPDDSTAAQVRLLDADIIMTAAVLGFTAGRLAVGHPVEFAIDPRESDEKLVPMRNTIARINKVLGDPYRFGGAAKVVTERDWSQGSMITGSPGAAKTPFEQRYAEPVAEAARKLRELASAKGGDAIGYQGYGAYTGFVDDPVYNRGSIQSTMRFNIPVDGYGERWSPPTFEYVVKSTKVGDHTDRAWGLILGQIALDEEMVQPEYTLDDEHGNIVGYTHGMVQAIYVSAQTGPWCTPFEIAVGTKTTKLASCFPCTTFMYANGFPPSAIHIGRGESWVPFFEVRPPGPTPPTPLAQVRSDLEIEPEEPPAKAPYATYHPITDTAIAALNDRWRLECRQHLSLGIRALNQDSKAAVAARHRPRLELLEEFLADRADDPYAGANLILDAVTLHDTEANRIDRVLSGVDLD
jgi:hypothetical protein